MKQTAVFIVLEPRGPRVAHKGTLLAQAWTVYATADLEVATCHPAACTGTDAGRAALEQSYAAQAEADQAEAEYYYNQSHGGDEI